MKAKELEIFLASDLNGGGSKEPGRKLLWFRPNRKEEEKRRRPYLLVCIPKGNRAGRNHSCLMNDWGHGKTWESTR